MGVLVWIQLKNEVGEQQFKTATKLINDSRNLLVTTYSSPMAHQLF